MIVLEVDVVAMARQETPELLLKRIGAEEDEAAEIFDAIFKFFDSAEASGVGINVVAD